MNIQVWYMACALIWGQCGVGYCTLLCSSCVCETCSPPEGWLQFMQCIVWMISATDVLVCMLMKGAAKCNNHCELQNSVNRLTTERRSDLGAFLRACLCQCFFTFNVMFWLVSSDCASSVTTCCIEFVDCKTCELIPVLHGGHLLGKHMNMTSSKSTCWI